MPSVAHTPTTPATDDRPLKILERADVPEDHKERLFALVRKAQALAAGDGVELQSEFGKTHVAMITKCNQFLRLNRGGEAVGTIELLVDDAAKERLRDAGFELGDHPSTLFRMFGWVVLDPMQGDLDTLETAVEAAWQKAKSSQSSGGLQ